MTTLPASEAYRLWAPTYESENVVTTLERGLVEQLSRPPAGLRLIDVGCGTARRLACTGARRAVGVDPCLEMLAAGRRARKHGPEVRLVQGDARCLPVPDGSFDLLWCRLMIGHVPDCTAVYSELGRVAAAGAQVLVTDFHPAAFAAGLRRTFRNGDEVHEVEHYPHPADRQVAAAAEAGLVLAGKAEAAVGPEVRPFYAAARKDALYAEQRGRPMVLALAFVRDG
ncbi:MAG TPA: methyltransferase domain-containing protein [Sphingomicrobium sp.]|nr:methyltransferase domain-containing protein [Sphingomicrobium sp.]